MQGRLRQQWRARMGRSAQPSAAVIDAQPNRASPQGGKCGYDAGKKVKGRKRHIVVDTLGLLLAVTVTAASVQNRDGAADVVAKACPRPLRLSGSTPMGPMGANAPEQSSKVMESGSRSCAGPAIARPASCMTRSSHSGRSRSRASLSFPSAGSSSGPMPGTSAGGGWSCTTIARLQPLLPGYGSPRRVSCSAGSLSPVDFVYTLLVTPVVCHKNRQVYIGLNYNKIHRFSIKLLFTTPARRVPGRHFRPA
jgi:hypothetical protein